MCFHRQAKRLHHCFRGSIHGVRSAQVVSELLYPDDLMISAHGETFGKGADMEVKNGEKVQRLDSGRTKTLVSGINLDLLNESEKDP